MSNKLYAAFASLVGARLRCQASGNDEWFEKHTARLTELLDEMPSGSGVDSGTKLDLDASTEDKLVFTTAFHHMNDGGYYDGWTNHIVVVTPSLQHGFNLRITGSNRNDIKDYLHELFATALNNDVSPQAVIESKGGAA